MSAGRALLRGNVSVTLLEARNRPGGRIHTVLHDDHPIELGAEFVHGESKPLFELLHEARQPVQLVSNKNRLVDEGRFRDVKIWEEAARLFNRMDPRATDVSFDEFASRQKRIDDGRLQTIRHLVEGFNAADASRISMKALRQASQAAEQMNGSRQFRVRRGYGRMVHFMAQDIDHRGGVLIKNTRVRQVAWKPGEVNIFAEHGGQIEAYKADAAVVTLPVGVLKSGEVTFEPALPDKTDAVRRLESGNVVKIGFQFRHSFWNNLGFIHSLDDLIPTWWDDPRGPVITGWAGGPRADALRHFSHSRLEETGLEILGKVFRKRRPWLRKQLVASHYWNWAEDPFSRGAYSYIPVNGLDSPQLLAAPVAETVFFCGEATVADAQTGTVFGAVESGLRAAREILSSDGFTR